MERTLFKTGTIFLVALLMLVTLDIMSIQAIQSPQIPLAGSAIPQFIQPLPLLTVSPFINPPAPNPPYSKTIATLIGNQPLNIHMCEFDAKVLPPGTIAAGVQPLTRVWGYIAETPGTVWTGCPSTSQDTYIGPVIVNNRGAGSTAITWANNLGTTASTQVLAYKYSTDETLHWADPNNLMCMMNLMGMAPMFGDPCSLNYGEDLNNPGTFTAAPIPAVPHLHGGEVPAEIDGSPDSWFTSDGLIQGHKYYTFGMTAGNTAIFKYPNTQEAAPIWFHDHTLGATRLNVYAGLAGAYFIQDPAIIPVSAGGTCAQDCLPANLHPLNEVVPVVIQDRMFDTNGQLFFQTDSAGGVLWTPNAEHPYWSPEFVGDTIVVNGKVWPFLSVQPKRYRFLFLNGSNARTYELFIINQATGAMGPPIWVISTDGGYLDNPVKIDPALGQKLVMQPGERYGVIIDFSGFPNTNLILRNTGRTPYPKGAPPQGSTLGRIMQFQVAAGPVADNSYNPDPASGGGQPLRSGTKTIVRLPGTPGGPAIVTAAGPTQNVQKTRQLTLNEVMGMPTNVIDPVTGVLTAYPGGPLEILVNNTKWSGITHHQSPRTDFTAITVNGVTTYFSELPKEGDTEVWEVVNLTADAHPIHLHLVQFQLISRQNFNVNKYNKAYAQAFPGSQTIIDPMTGLPYAPGVFIPAFGPPLDYNIGNARALGGNPDITPYLQGIAQPPVPNEAGWKDTVIMYPGQVTRIAVRWAPTDIPTSALSSSLYYPFDPSGWDPILGSYQYNYVWHCHIIDHEDNEMMRPDVVQVNPLAPAPSGRMLVKGVDY